MKLFSRSVFIAIMFLVFILFVSFYLSANKNLVVGAVVRLFS